MYTIIDMTTSVPQFVMPQLSLTGSDTLAKCAEEIKTLNMVVALLAICTIVIAFICCCMDQDTGSSKGKKLLGQGGAGQQGYLSRFWFWLKSLMPKFN